MHKIINENAFLEHAFDNNKNSISSYKLQVLINLLFCRGAIRPNSVLLLNSLPRENLLSLLFE